MNFLKKDRLIILMILGFEVLDGVRRVRQRVDILVLFEDPDHILNLLRIDDQLILFGSEHE